VQHVIENHFAPLWASKSSIATTLPDEQQGTKRVASLFLRILKYHNSMVMHPNTKTRLFRILSLIFGVVVALIAAEFAAGYFFNPLDNTLLYRIPDPILGWRLKPNARYTRRDVNTFAWTQLNSRGWHDIEHSFNKPPGVYRIVILGDSFMEASPIDLQDTMAMQLNQRLKQKGNNVEVINLGVGGYGTLQEYYLLKNEGIRYLPDLVLLGFFLGNDLIDNSMEMKRKIVGEGSITLVNRPFLLPGPENEWNVTHVDFGRTSNAFKDARNKLEGITPFGRSRLYQLIQPMFDPQKNLPRSENGRHTLDVHRCVEDDGCKSGWIVTRRILIRLKEEANNGHAMFMVVIVPALYEADPERIQDDKILRSELKNFCMNPPMGAERLKTILKQEGIVFIDLIPEFRREQQKQELYLPDMHWNRWGHHLAALQIAEYLESQHLP